MTKISATTSDTRPFDARGLITFSVLCLFFLGFGIAGVDFGRHWDEPKLLSSVEKAFDNGIMLPGWYQYPSLTFWIGLGAKSVHQLLSDSFQIKLSFPLMWRGVMVIFTALTGLWTYLLSWYLSGKRAVALLAAGIVFLSPELLYHARWIAPDTLMMQFGIASSLTLYLSTLPSPQKKRRLWQSSLLAGFACSAKYPGGMFILPIILVALTGVPKTLQWKARFKQASVSMLIFVLTVILLTPGMIIEARQFAQDVYSEIQHYRRGHNTYSMSPGLEHLWLNLRYLSLCISPNRYVQLLGGMGVLVGVFFSARRGYFTTISLLVVPIAYLVYFSSQRVMIVRNLMVLIPFIAILCAMGVDALVERWSRARITWYALASLGAFNITHAQNSVSSLLYSKPLYECINDYTSNYPETQFLTSSAFRDSSVDLRNLVLQQENHKMTQVLFWSDQRPKPDWLTNRANRYTVVAGPNDVNWSYYPSWLGPRRLLAVSLEDAQKMNIQLRDMPPPSGQSR